MAFEDDEPDSRVIATMRVPGAEVNGGLEATVSGSGGSILKEEVATKQTLILKSPMGAEAMTYTWPLKKGKGSMRRSEVSKGNSNSHDGLISVVIFIRTVSSYFARLFQDKQDEAAEIVETIR